MQCKVSRPQMLLINSFMDSCMICLYGVYYVWLLKLQTMDNSGASLDVVLWGEQATAFLAEQVHRDRKATPQTVIFVGTLVKCFAGTSIVLLGNCCCESTPKSTTCCFR